MPGREFYSKSAPPHAARFAAALMLLVAISLAGVAIDNRALSVGRRISLETFRADQLELQVSRLRLKIEELTAPQRLQAALRTAAAKPAPQTAVPVPRAVR